MQHKDRRGPPGACTLRIGRYLRTLATLAALGLAFELGRSTGPVTVPPAAPVETPATRQAQALETELAVLEAKLHQGMAWTQHQGELARRHEQVSAIACEAAVSHAQSAERLAQKAARRSVRQAARKQESSPAPGHEAPDPPEPAVHHATSRDQRSG